MKNMNVGVKIIDVNVNMMNVVIVIINVYVLIILKKNGKFCFTINLLILEVFSLILKITFIFLSYSSQNSKFPMIIIFEIIFFIIDICLNINLFKDEIKNWILKIKEILNRKIRLNFIFISNDENKNILANINKRVYLEDTLYKIINDLINSNKNLKFYFFGKIYGKKNN